jgi:hypothetical protein
MPFETNQHLFAGQGDDDAHEDDGDLTEKLSQIMCRLRLMNFHRTLAIGFQYTLAPVRTRNYLMKRDAKFAPVGLVTVLFDDASPNPRPLDFLRTDRECLEKAWQAIQPTVRFTSPEWLLLGRSIRRLKVTRYRSIRIKVSASGIRKHYRRCCVVLGTLTTMYRNSLPLISLIQWGTSAATN